MLYEVITARILRLRQAGIRQDLSGGSGHPIRRRCWSRGGRRLWSLRHGILQGCPIPGLPGAGYGGLGCHSGPDPGTTRGG